LLNEFIKKKTGLNPIISLTTPDSIKESLRQYHKNIKTEFDYLAKGKEKGQEGIESGHKGLKKLAKKENLSIILTGWIEEDELKSAYYSSDVVVTPSIYLDPFPTVNLETMACKKPIIGTCFWRYSRNCYW